MSFTVDSPPPADLPPLASLLLTPSYSRPGSIESSVRGTPSRSARPSSKVSFRDYLGPPLAPRTTSGGLLGDAGGLLASYLNDGSPNLTPSSGKKKTRPQHPREDPPPASPPPVNGIEMLLSITSNGGLSTPVRSSGNRLKKAKSTTKSKAKQGRKQLQTLSASKSSSGFLFNQSSGDNDPPPHSAFLDSFHFVSHMLHRTTEVSGAIPDSEINPFVLSKKHEQIEVLAKNKEMNRVISSLRVLSKQFDDIVHSVSSHRKELGKSIRQTHTTYVRLFERMLFVVLKLQRRKDREMDDELKGYRDQISSLVLQNDLLQAQLLKLGDQNSALVGLNQSLHVDNDAQKEELSQLQKYFKLYHEQREKMRVDAVRMADGRLELEARLKREEEAMLERFRRAEQEWAEERKAIYEEMKTIKTKTKVIVKTKIQDTSSKIRRKPKVKPKPVPVVVKKENKVVELADGICQTEVNDDGLWQKQDGWVINTDEDVLAKALWRRAIRFVSCPCCKGAGEFLKNAIEESRKPKKITAKDPTLSDSDSDEVDIDEPEGEVIKKKCGRRSAVDKCWMLPDELVEFLCNLPKTVQATSPKPLSWVCKEINYLFEEKHRADLQDEKEGQQTQTMNDFLMEGFLKRYGLRRLAELNLFVLVISIKEYYKKNALVHVMARFMNLIDEPKHHHHAGKSGGGDDSGGVVPVNRYLDTSFLTAFLWSRDKCLSTYFGPEVYGNEKRLAGGEGSMEGLPSHVVVEKGTSFFVPLDRVVFIVKLVLNFLTPRKLATYSRQIEKKCQLLQKDGRVVKGDGARMIIRSMMRASMLKKAPGNELETQVGDEEDKEGSGDTKAKEEGGGGAEGHDEVQVVVNLYDTLEMIMEILTLRTHHMEDQLKRYFVEGDDNGDGVLSYEEFDALLKRIAPKFSERRILRMFREALTSGEDDGFAIEKGVFAGVCKNHGLVKLVDTEELDAVHAEAQAKAKILADRLIALKEERRLLGAIGEGAEEDEEELDL